VADLTELGEIAKRNYETGEYGDCILRVGTTVLSAMRSKMDKPPKRPAWMAPNDAQDLTGVRIVLDRSLPAANMWRLVRLGERDPMQSCKPFARDETIVKEGAI
jgi:hypothetical protein